MVDVRIMFRHILPNAMTSSLTFLPFILAGSVTTLTALDFLGFGLPVGLALARRAAAAGQEQPQCPLARLHRLHRDRRHDDPAGLHRRSRARRLQSAQGAGMSEVLLEVRDLSVTFGAGATAVQAVKGVSFAIARGETLALVGESGSGKSVTALSVLQLLPYPMAKHPTGSIRFQGRELVGAAARELLAVRGNRVSMIFQEPMTSLNPLHTIERQVNEVLILHKGLNREAARRRTLELLEQVGIPEAAKRLDAYPHQLSGGQRQRVMIAMALANEPDLLIADEPTTALDVTIQAQILKLLKSLQAKYGMALLFITHDLGIVRKMADRVCVMTKGEIVEQGPVAEVFDRPQHPYTRHLLSAEPKGRPAAADPDAPEILRLDDLKVHFPIKRGVLRRTMGYVKAVDGVSIALREGHTIGWSVNQARARPRSASPCCGSSAAPAASASTARICRHSARAISGRCASRCRSSSRTLSARSARACRSARSSVKGWRCTASARRPSG
jgi:ABC-type dipeptide/oligopeptide/nickel transport system ATPase component